MGFFSGEEKINVYANTCHLADVDSTALQDAVLYAILSGQSIASSLMNTTMNQMSTQIRPFRAYAKSTYSLGLPEVTYEQSITLPEQDVIDAISADTSRPYGVVLDFHYVAPLVPTMVIAPYLFSTRGWDSNTGEITVIPDAFKRDLYWGISYTGVVYDVTLNASYTSVTITYEIQRIKRNSYYDHNAHKSVISYTTEETTYPTEIQAVPTGLSYGRDYCVAAYYILDSEGTALDAINWWYYDMSSYLYSALVPSASIDSNNSMLPVIPIRYDNQDMTRDEVQDTELYLTSKTLLKKIGVSIDDVATLVDENESSDDIDHAYIMFGIDLQSDEIASIRYMAEFFDFISDKGQATLYTNIEDSLLSGKEALFTTGLLDYNTYNFFTGTAKANSIIQDEVSWINSDNNTSVLGVTSNDSMGSFEEFGLKTSVSYSYIRSEVKTGNIGVIGYATKSWNLGDPVYGVSAVFNYGKYSIDDAELVLKVQITDNSYKQITIKGLVHRNYIYGNHAVVTTLNSVILDEDEHNFILPLHYNLSDTFPTQIKNQIYQDSMVLVLNSVVKTSVAWYATGFFKFIIMVVGVIISIYTGGAGAFIAKLALAVAAGAMAVLMFLLESIIISLAISMALKYVATWVGPEIMGIISLVVAVLAVASKIPAVSSITVLGVTMPTAMSFMKLAGLLVSSASSAYTGLIEGVTEEISSFGVYAEEQYELLEEYSDLIDDLDPDAVDLIDALSYPNTLQQMANTTPEEYYDLAIHTGNIGVLSLSGPMTFHNIALKLPEPRLI